MHTSQNFTHPMGFRKLLRLESFSVHENTTTLVVGTAQKHFQKFWESPLHDYIFSLLEATSPLHPGNPEEYLEVARFRVMTRITRGIPSHDPR